MQELDMKWSCKLTPLVPRSEHSTLSVLNYNLFDFFYSKFDHNTSFVVVALLIKVFQEWLIFNYIWTYFLNKMSDQTNYNFEQREYNFRPISTKKNINQVVRWHVHVTKQLNWGHHLFYAGLNWTESAQYLTNYCDGSTAVPERPIQSLDLPIIPFQYYSLRGFCNYTIVICNNQAPDARGVWHQHLLKVGDSMSLNSM